MLNALSGWPRVVGTERLAAVLRAFGGVGAHTISHAEDAILAALWGPEDGGIRLKGPVADRDTAQAALSRLGGFLLDHRFGARFGLGIRDANAILPAVNRTPAGPQAGALQPTLGMAAIAAAVEPGILRTKPDERLTRWFVLRAAGRRGLEHLVPAPLVGALCEAGSEPPLVARWLWDTTPALKARHPQGWPDRAAARRWLLGPQAHAANFLRPMIARGEACGSGQAPPRGHTALGLSGGEALDFGTDGNAGDFCIDGTWHAAEPTYRWGMAPAAMLTFHPLTPPDARLLMTVQLLAPPELLARQELHMTVTVGRRVVVRDRWDERTPDRLVIDLDPGIEPGVALPVAFQLWPPLRPGATGSEDRRALGLCVSHLRLIAW